ncbi:MAG: squalene--hopene cyclase [Thermoanaerobaculia bacterium]
MSVQEITNTSPASDPLSRAPRSVVNDAIASARKRLLALQHEDGHWCGELEGDTILESEYVLTLYFLLRRADERMRKAAEYLRRQQLSDGAWANYPGGPSDVSASVKAYFVLKLMGDDPDAPHMARARETIRELGGVEACNSFTKIYLAMFGQYDWNRCPAVPPEMILLPDASPFNIYKMSCWSRDIVVPLSIIWATRPSCPVPENASIDELTEKAAPAPPANQRSARDRAWTGFFTALDVALKRIEKSRLRPLRRKAITAAEEWILERLSGSDGLGAIFPPIINTIIAFKALGYEDDDPRLVSQLDELEKLVIEESDDLRVQPCFSPIWDTAIAIQALCESGSSGSSADILRAARWLLGREVTRPGDVQRLHPEVPLGGWYFEYANEFYPDADDTAEVLTALSYVRFPDSKEDRRRVEAMARGIGWQLAMQNCDGGWGAFDLDCDDYVLTLIPFADHNAMIDPSCEDITGRSIEMLFRLGFDADHNAISRAVRFLLDRQDDHGTWYGRWGCNYVYGTWLAISALETAGEPMNDDRYQRTSEWLRAKQNHDGGWGELPRSYDEPEMKGVGPSTPSQTAWALLTLFKLGDYDSPEVRRGVQYLLDRQLEDGSWNDEYWSGTGFPRVFYLKYHLYALYFPLWALARFERHERGAARREITTERTSSDASAREVVA